MKRFVVLAGTAATLLSGMVTVQAQDAEPDVDCANAMTQSDMNFCAGKDYEAADKDLNAAYKAAMAAVKEQDKELGDINPNYVGAEAALRKAQRAWIDYRDGQCDLAGFGARGGSMEPLLVSSCLADLTKKRTEELKQVTESPEN